MQVHLFEAFIVLAEELNYRRAAERLALSQPGLSQQIWRLERELGARLFRRDGTGTHLTPLGVELLPLARTAVEAVGHVSDAAKRRSAHGPGGRCQLRVGILADGLGPLTWPLLTAFARERPDVDIVLIPMGFVEAFTAVESGTAHVVLATGPLSSTDHQQVATVGQDAIAALFTAGHPLADEQAVDLERVARSLTYDTPARADPAFRRFWVQQDLRERTPRHLSHLREPPDGPVLDDLVRRVGEIGGVGLWPASIRVTEASGCVVRPLVQPLTAPRQIAVLRNHDHARALLRVGIAMTRG